MHVNRQTVKDVRYIFSIRSSHRVLPMSEVVHSANACCFFAKSYILDGWLFLNNVIVQTYVLTCLGSEGSQKLVQVQNLIAILIPNT